MYSDPFNSLIQNLQTQYHHIIGEQSPQNISSENIIAAITNYYEDIISCMPGNVYWLDKNCRAIGCNKNVLEMFGFNDTNQYKGLTFEDMARIGKWTNETADAFKRDTLEVLMTGKPRLNIEEPSIPHYDGRTIYFLTSRVPIFDQNNNIIGVVGISIDITELKLTQSALKVAKEKAEAASKAKSEFIANMSHDVKTPLSGIIGLSELLTYRLTGEVNLEFAQTILSSGKQLLIFFNNCLEIFKLEAGDITLVTESFQLKSIVNDILELYLPAVKAKGITLNIKYDPHIPEFVNGSYAGIYRILLNLVGNAVKFTHKGHVTITVALESLIHQQAMLKFVVTDTGIGIPEEKLSVIFERFTRLIPSYKGTYEGSGIGLYIVQRYVQSMQGDVLVASKEGEGSQFTVYLPLDIPNHDINPKQIPLIPIEPLETASTSMIKTTTPAKILLVEDNLTAQLMESSLLASMNYQVDLADSGEKALEMFEPGKYDLIFMDIGLPGIQGDAVAKLVRKMESGSTHHVPIIALTAHTTDDINHNYLAAGMNNVISKPLSREQAAHIIEGYIKR